MQRNTDIQTKSDRLQVLKAVTAVSVALDTSALGRALIRRKPSFSG